MTPALQILERLTLVAPLGIGFWDTVADMAIGAGLTVVAYPRDNPAHRVPVLPNRSGVYAAAHLPRLREAEQGSGDAAYWQAPPPRRPFIIEVDDPARRFHPCQFAVDLPMRGLVTLDCAALDSPLASPPAGASHVPLYSAPARPVPAGMAVLRASLCDTQSGQPGAWAVVEAHHAGGFLGRGVADAAGQLALIVPWPELQVPGPPLREQTWVIQIAAAYSGWATVPPIPDLCTVLNQPPATLWADSDLHTPLTQVVLPFGQELVLRSGYAADGSLLSNLLVTPAGSPP
jgi:hypothetical protein